MAKLDRSTVLVQWKEEHYGVVAPSSRPDLGALVPSQVEYQLEDDA
jgi:hypothetical protein